MPVGLLAGAESEEDANTGTGLETAMEVALAGRLLIDRLLSVG